MRRPALLASDSDGADASASGWHALTEVQQLMLARQALCRAAEILADRAELLAEEMEDGMLPDCGGPDALRLFAALVRATNCDALGVIGGHA